MRFLWRDKPLTSHDGWIDKIRGTNPEKPGKNLSLGTSAPTLADVWAGPLAVATVLALRAELAGFVAATASVEAQTSFDAFSGPRNHDLLLVGDADGGRTIVSVEAKVNEPLGSTIGAYRSSSLKKDPTSNAGHRLDGLLEAIRAPNGSGKSVEHLRYQLYTGVAGALAAAVDANAEQAVFLVHELVPDQADLEAQESTTEDLVAFVNDVFSGGVSPGGTWCTGPLSFAGSSRLDPSVKLHIGFAMTNLRTDRFPSPAS